MARQQKNGGIKKADEKRGDVCRSENAGEEELIDRAESGSMASSESSLGEEISLSKCMLRLLHSPAADCEEADKLKESGFRGEEISQTMLLAQAMLTKAVKSGDVSAFREVKALIDLENDGNGQFERLLNGIREAIRFEKSGKKEKGPD